MQAPILTGTVADVITLIGRSPELSLLFKATLALIVGLGAAAMARRVRASRRHLLLACTLAGVLALPLVMTLASIAPIDLPIDLRVASAGPVVTAGDVGLASAGATDSTRAGGPTSAPARDETSSGASTDASSAARLAAWLFSASSSSLLSASSLSALATLLRAIWAAGTLLALGALAIALVRLMRIRRQGVPWLDAQPLVQTLAAEAGVRRRVDLLLHEAVGAPLTCGVRHPAIVMPEDAPWWQEADLRRALVHELEHVRRRDWLVQLMARVACAVYWFHPLAWAASRQLCLDAERACDDRVIEQAEETAYADQLVSLAQRLKGMSGMRGPILAMANRSDLARRVAALLDARQPRGRAGRPATMTAIVLAVVVIVAIAPVRPVRASSERGSGGPGTIVSVQPVGGDERRSQHGTPFDQRLLEAAAKGHVDDLTPLLDAGANVNAAIAGDGSPLIAAAAHGRIAAVRLLLDRGADPNMPVPGDGTPLIAAARKGHHEIVELLLSRGANIDQVQEGDENPLIQASAEGRLAVVTLLIARGADVNARVWVQVSRGRGDQGDRVSGEWRTPLGMALKGGHTDVAAALRAAGARQ